MSIPGSKLAKLKWDWLDDALDRNPRMRDTYWWQVLKQGAVASIGGAFTHEDARVRGTAIWFLGHLRAKRAATALIVAMRSEPDTNNRCTAADALGSLDSKRGVGPLIDILLHDHDITVRERAASGLRLMSQDERITDALIAVMANKDEDSCVREMVADAICGHDPAKAALVLVESLKDPSPNVRYWAAAALSHSKYTPAIPELERLAREDISICFEPNTRTDRNPQGIVNGSVCAQAAGAIISIKRDLHKRLTEEEKQYIRHLNAFYSTRRLPFEPSGEPGKGTCISIKVV